MRSQYFRFAVLLASALTLGGCETFMEPGAPDQSFDIDQDIQDLEEAFKTKGTTIISYYSAEAKKATTKAKKATGEAAEATGEAAEATGEAAEATEEAELKDLRNQFISQRLTLINIQYIKFIRRFAVEKAQLDTAADILIIGVNLAGTLVGAASTKGILAAISGGTAASRTSINKNFFHEKTVPVLVTAMNAERKKALVPILKGIGESIDNYRFPQALSDLHLYYQAGTFIGALQAIQKDSGAKEKEADEEIKNLAIPGPVPVVVHKRRVNASDYVWDLVDDNEDVKLRSLANALGVPEDKEALDGILDIITLARTAEDMEVIEQAIAVIKGE